MKTQIIPSILVDSKEKFIEQIKASQELLNWIQLDIADGKFVPNTTWAKPQVVEENVKIKMELHLMVESPSEEIKRWTQVPQIERVLFHFESNSDPKEIIPLIHEQGWQAGIVLNPDTNILAIEEYIDRIEDVMFMGVQPGFQGQELIDKVLEKIKEFKDKHPDCFSQLDGSVNEKTLPDIIPTKVDAVCPGSAIFGNENSPKENIKYLRGLIQNLEQR